MSAEPYQALLRMMGVAPDSKLYEPTKIIDACASETLSQSVINQFKDYLYCEFDCKSEVLHIGVDAESFYIHLLLSFVAHLDAYFFYHHESIRSVICQNNEPLGCYIRYRLLPSPWRVALVGVDCLAIAFTPASVSQ